MNSKTDELNSQLENARKQVVPGTTWKHYKGGIYEVIDSVILTENGLPGILYFRIAGPGFSAHLESEICFVRPLEEWFDTIEEDIDGTTHCLQRFEKCVRRNVWVTGDESL